MTGGLQLAFPAGAVQNRGLFSDHFIAKRLAGWPEFATLQVGELHGTLDDLWRAEGALLEDRNEAQTEDRCIQPVAPIGVAGASCGRASASRARRRWVVRRLEPATNGSLAWKAPVSNRHSSGSCSGVRERRRTLAADDRRGLANKIVVLEGLRHE